MQRNLETCKGLPTGIQIGAFPHQDEIVLRLMQEFDKLFNYNASKIILGEYPVDVVFETMPLKNIDSVLNFDQ